MTPKEMKNIKLVKLMEKINKTLDTLNKEINNLNLKLQKTFVKDDFDCDRIAKTMKKLLINSLKK